MKDALLEEHSSFRVVSRVPFERFSWNSTSRNSKYFRLYLRLHL